MKRIFAALLVLTLAAPAVAGWDEGIDAYYRGDFLAAIPELRPLAEQGNAAARWLLGDIYSNGRGVPLDYAEAAKWFSLAAEQGYAYAQFNLGFMYSNGQGVPQDYVQAHKWYDLSAAHFPDSENEDRDMAVKNRDLAAAKMTSEQIIEAQNLAWGWQAAFEKRNSGG